MERKVLLTECMNRRVLALLEDEKVTEFHFGSSGEKKSCRLGEIYVGRVRKILPNIGGAFVEIANSEQCYFALDEKYTPVFTNKIGKKPLVIGDELLVQVEKEAVKTKQPVVTGNLNFTGQYVVLTSGNRTIGVSGKIHGVRKEELQKLGQDYIGCDFGLIFRTNCVETEETQIRAEIDKLAENYHRIVEYGKMRTCFSCLQSAPDPCVQALRDIYKKDLTEIIVEETVEDGVLYKEVQTYLETGEPVGSRTISKYTDLNLSSATIRNEMSDLEEMGYILQPHTSAGRIPSDKGYRFYVDNLIAEKDKEVSDMKEFVIEHTEKMEQVLQQVAKLLANNTNYTTMITAPQYHHNSLKFIQLSNVDDEHILAVVVLEGNLVKNKMIPIEEPIDNEHMLKLNMLLNTHLNGLSLDQINLGTIAVLKEKAGIHSKVISDVLDAVAEAISEDEDLEIYTSGATNIFKYPELSDSTKASELIYALEEKQSLTDFVKDTESDDSDNTGIQVYIGNEAL